jgi:hypothetical protein
MFEDWVIDLGFDPQRDSYGDYAQEGVLQRWQGYEAGFLRLKSTPTQQPECTLCNDSGIVGRPPVVYYDCPDCHVTEMRLCEAQHTQLRPNQLYRFTVDPYCLGCIDAETRSK